jgi:hypothetical protein
MTLVAEAGDMSRFDEPRSLMHFFGLTSSEHSSGGKRSQGGITKCGTRRGLDPMRFARSAVGAGTACRGITG